MKFSQAPVESSLIPCLDEDALDQAIRALKDLSQGSRLVGIVSHVAELKERIDKKIIVTKKRTEDGVGSTICIEG